MRARLNMSPMLLQQYATGLALAAEVALPLTSL